jgi:hypothetical protein
MRIKTIIATGLVALSGAVAVTQAEAANKADTQVTIQGGEGEYFGYVKSSNKQQCANNRKVKVYKMLGSSPSPSSDKKIGSDTSSPNGDGYMWNAGNTGYKKGKFYAKAGATDYCKSDLSPVIKR